MQAMGLPLVSWRMLLYMQWDVVVVFPSAAFPLQEMQRVDGCPSWQDQRATEAQRSRCHCIKVHHQGTVPCLMSIHGMKHVC